MNATRVGKEGARGGTRGSPTLWLYSAAVAVPKKKTSKSRRDKRRATHRLAAPRVNTCPQCGRPKQPHRMCPNCKTYAGREIEPLRTPAS
jgi:large subunit ribosomal protein L32